MFRLEKAPTPCTAAPLTELSKYGMWMSWLMWKPCEYFSLWLIFCLWGGRISEYSCLMWSSSFAIILWKDRMGMPAYVLKRPGLPTCTDFRGTYRFWPSITISRFHAVVYRFWMMREFLALADFVLVCFRRYSRILPASCTYRQSRHCVAAINSPTNAVNQC